MHLDILTKRDVYNFMEWRDVGASDDYRVSQFLLATFALTTAIRRPELVNTAERVQELNDVCSRRASGVVRLLEIGHRIVGTYALMRPNTKECLAWIEGAAYLRAVAIASDFQGIKLTDSLMADAIRVAQEWNVTRICLHVIQGSEGLARLYQRYGFQADSSGDQFGKGFDLNGFQMGIDAKRELA